MKHLPMVKSISLQGIIFTIRGKENASEKFKLNNNAIDCVNIHKINQIPNFWLIICLQI
jgi:hypothetical protein